MKIFKPPRPHCGDFSRFHAPPGRTPQRNLYEQHGVKEYWIVDPELDSVKCYRLQNGRYAAAQELATEQPHATLTTPLLPGFAFSLSDLFA